MTEKKQAESLILMTAYNGERYIRQQLDSIREQTVTDWHLIIQDDGSTDRTEEILQEYCGKDPRIEYRKNTGRIHSADANFHSLIRQARQMEAADSRTFRYVFFADQDDVWLPDKLEKMIPAVSGKEPCFCFADMDIIDGQGRRTGGSIMKVNRLVLQNPLACFFTHNVYGCNSAMNAAQFRMIPLADPDEEYARNLSHDNLSAKTAALTGKVIFLPEITMHYRRHGGNVTGQQGYGFGASRILRRMLGLKELAKDHAVTYDQTLIALRLLRQQKITSAPILDEIERAIRKGGPAAAAFLIKYRIGFGSRVRTVSRAGILLSGMYRKYLKY